MVKLLLTIVSFFIAGMIFYIVLGLLGFAPFNGFYMHGMPMAFHGFGMALFWIFVVVLIYMVVYQVFIDGNRRQDDTDALYTLKERYARGDIDADTYKKMKRTLED